MLTAGEVLKSKRESLKKSLDTVSLETKIQKRFLEYIENNQFSIFDSEVFLTGFIKIYAQYLDLDTGKILALYRRSNPRKIEKNTKSKKQKIFKRNITKELLTPKNIVTAVLILFLFGIIGYIGIQIYKFQSPPEITITEPIDNTKTENSEITVKGKTEINTIIEINGLPVEIDNNGNFEKAITLQEGINLVTIKAKKNSNNTLETQETFKIIYEKKDEITPEEEIIKNTFTLEIVDSSAWIKLDIDDENKLSQVVEPSKTEFVAMNKIHIITGRVSSTVMYWNGEILEWKKNQITGVAELTCTISENSVNCE